MKFTLLFVVLAIFVAKSFSLECYVCDSDLDPNCHSMYDRNVRTELCDDSRLIGYQRNACLKIVTFEFGNRKTLRQCARVGPRKDPCFEQGNAYDLSVCEVCDNHLCNGSTNLKKNIWIMSLPVLGIMFYKIMMM